MSLSQSQSQQSRKVDNSQFDSLSRIDEDFMLRPLDSERNRKTSKQKQNDFKVPKRVVPLPQSQVPMSQPLPMSHPLKRPYLMEPIYPDGSTKRIKLEPQIVANGNISIKKEDLMDDKEGNESILMTLEPIPDSLYTEPIPVSSDRFAIGRADVCNVAISDDRLSKIHCILKSDNGTIWLLDMSTNSCKVNQVSLGKGMKRQLLEGDLVYLFDDNINKEFIAFKVKMSQLVLADVSTEEIKVLEQSLDDLKLKELLIESM